MKNVHIAFVGAGNMATSVIGGLIADGYRPDSISVADIDLPRTDALQKRFLIQRAESNQQAVAQADIVVLAVKPQVMHGVCAELAAAARTRRPLVISIAAGIRTSSIAQWIAPDLAIVRAMPNTPALVGSGATALFANEHATAAQRAQAESLVRAVGCAVWLEREELMDVVTALSGSGPAYFFYLMEAMDQVGRELGLPADVSRLLTLQTAFGAAKMALESNIEIATLRRNVTSPGGTTERAIQTLETRQTSAAVADAVRAATQRARELADLFGST